MSDKNARVAICSTGELYGGVDEWILTFSKEMLKLKEVDFCVLLLSDGVLFRKLKEARVPVFLVGRNLFHALFAIAKFFKDNDIQLVHTHGEKANVVYGVVAKSMKIKLMKTQHGNPEFMWPVSFRGLRRFVNYILNKVIEPIFDRVIYVSTDVKGFYS